MFLWEYYNFFNLLTLNSRYTWDEEIRLRLPEVPVTRIYVLTKTNERFIDPAVVITSYDIMSKTKDLLLNLKFGIIILVRFLTLHFKICC